MTEIPGNSHENEDGDDPRRHHDHPRRFGDDDRQRTRDQIGLIRQAIGVTVDTPDDADFTFLCDPEHILVRNPTADEPDGAKERVGAGDGVGARTHGHGVEGAGVSVVDAVRDAVRRRQDVFDGELGEPSTPIAGVARFRLPNRRGTGAPDVIEALDVIEQELRETLGRMNAVNQVSPDHVVHVCKSVSHVHTSSGRCCPAIEPQETGLSAPWPPVSADSGAGAGVRVAVFDTGLNPDAATRAETPWLAGVTGDDESGGSSGVLREYEGHGTFIAGVVRCQAPAATVHVYQHLKPGGGVCEGELAGEIEAMLNQSSELPHVISLSAGFTTRNNADSLGLEAVWDRLRLWAPNTVIVAAAGNEGSPCPFWPAAFPWAVGVGSLDHDGAVSSFSNHGVSADVYALGRNHINAFPDGELICKETPDKGDVRVFNTGLARWSGTSFSAPMVAGMIAARMTRDDLSAPQARDAVLREAKRESHPQLGSIYVIPTPP
jgi:hypothetical protein